MIVELSILTIIIVVILFIRYKRQHTYELPYMEPFEDFELHSCPKGYKTYNLSNGDQACCNGDMIGKTCIGDSCVLTGSGGGTVPKCSSIMLKEYKEKGENVCPPSLPSYFEDEVNKKKGCTSGPMNNTRTGPQQPTQPVCVIYSTMDENIKSKDSCWNQKEMEEFPCFGDNCTKTLVQTAANTPVQIAIGFTDSTGMHRMAYTRESMTRFLDATKPNWREKGMDLDKNVNVAEVAKRFYVERTLGQDDIEL